MSLNIPFGKKEVNTGFFDKNADKNAGKKSMEVICSDYLGLNTAIVPISVAVLSSNRQNKACSALHLMCVSDGTAVTEVSRPMFYAPVLAETSILTVRTSGDMRELENAAETLRRQYFPNEVVRIRRAQSYFAESYVDELRLAKLLGLASLAYTAIFVGSILRLERIT